MKHTLSPSALPQVRTSLGLGAIAILLKSPRSCSRPHHFETHAIRANHGKIETLVDVCELHLWTKAWCESNCIFNNNHQSISDFSHFSWCIDLKFLVWIQTTILLIFSLGSLYFQGTRDVTGENAFKTQHIEFYALYKVLFSW